MTTTLLSVSITPNGSPFSPRPNIIPTNNRWHLPSTITFIRTTPPSSSSSKLISLCSPSSSTSIAEDSTPPPPPPPPSDAELPDQPQSPPTTISTNSSLRGCKGCGREEIERGCNGEGRIQGGIATVPGFGWWPIKAYRPCPGFVASGGRYRRQGQSMDEVAFGRVERQTTSIIASDDTDSQSSKKKQSSKKLRK